MPEAGILGPVPLAPCPRYHLEEAEGLIDLGEGPTWSLGRKDRPDNIHKVPSPCAQVALGLPAPSPHPDQVTHSEPLFGNHLFLSPPPQTHGIILLPRLVLMPRAKAKGWGRGTKIVGDTEALESGLSTIPLCLLDQSPAIPSLVRRYLSKLP